MFGDPEYLEAAACFNLMFDLLKCDGFTLTYSRSLLFL